MITIESIPHALHRYPTVGDWINDAFGDLHIRVSSTGNWRYDFLVALHELIEATLCNERGIDEPTIAEFDMRFEEQRELGMVQGEPGHALDAPYRKEHQFAESIERAVAEELGVDWGEYEATLERLP